jgi:hypothetical protein
MMMQRVAFLLLALFSVSVAAADYKAGTHDVVKNWGPRDYEQLTKATMPIFAYIADEGFKGNQMAKTIEGDLIASDEVKGKLKSFVTMKVDSDGKKEKGWPKDWLGRGSNGAAVLIASSDLRVTIWIDRKMPKTQMNKMFMAQAMDSVLNYEKKRREVAEARAKKDEKPEVPEKTEEEKKGALAGFLNGDKDKAANNDKDAAKAPSKKREDVVDE